MCRKIQETARAKKPDTFQTEKSRRPPRRDRIVAMTEMGVCLFHLPAPYVPVDLLGSRRPSSDHPDALERRHPTSTSCGCCGVRVTVLVVSHPPLLFAQTRDTQPSAG